MPTERDYERIDNGDDDDFAGDDLYVTDEDGVEYGDIDIDQGELEEIDNLESEEAAAMNTILQGIVADEAIEQHNDDAEGEDEHVSPSIAYLLRLLATRTGGRVRISTARAAAANHDDDDDDEYSNSTSNWHPEVTEPQEGGVRLLNGGEFGRLTSKSHPKNSVAHVSRLLRKRGMRVRPMYREDMTSHLIPNSNGVAVASYDANIYAGQFSADSSFYYTCCQDFRLHVYDTTTAPKRFEPNRRRNNDGPSNGHETNLKVIKTIQGSPGRWTITDSHLSLDNQRIIYSSITPTVYMANTLDSSPTQTAINFASRSERQRISSWDERFSIWSCRFSADGNEIVAGGVAGGDGKIFVYDLLANKRTVAISAHDDDVNSCCWADTASGNVLISASDDTFLKVWDRRSLGASQKPAGVLVGHTEGITNVSAKGDGRYIISNGKDQALRLWDLRAMRGSADFDTFAGQRYGIRNYDYRYGYYPKPRYAAHPRDCSVMTYRGHAVLKTLIRCHFSPAETTGAQYLYSGSADGRIHIWSLDGRVVQVLDRARTLPMSYDPSEPEPPTTLPHRDGICVRDVSWHSKEAVMMSVGWEGSRGGSVVARHEWKGLSKMGNRLEDYLERRRADKADRAGRQQPSAREAHVPGAFDDDDDL